MFKDVIDDDGLYALSYTEEKDANDCRVVKIDSVK